MGQVRRYYLSLSAFPAEVQGVAGASLDAFGVINAVPDVDASPSLTRLANLRHACGLMASADPWRSLVSRTSTWSPAATSTQPPCPLRLDLTHFSAGLPIVFTSDGGDEAHGFGRRQRGRAEQVEQQDQLSHLRR